MNRGIGELDNIIRDKAFLDGLGIPANLADQIHLRFLAQGEYNQNFVFEHPVTGERLVLRRNFGSQMHLEKQITYEYQALQLLASSGRTPVPLYCDDSRTLLPQGILVERYIEGERLDYAVPSDLDGAAGCLADIHSVKISENPGLLYPGDGRRAILEECEQMFRVYETSELRDEKKAERIRRLLDAGKVQAQIPTVPRYLCCVNTEVNNSNFLVNRESGQVSLVDWEKPVLGDPAQDLGHFLAPTTTFWKTDIFLSSDQIETFIDAYIRHVDSRFDTFGLRGRTHRYLETTCLRGLTWCAMAWVQYRDPSAGLRNADTAKKLDAYLEEEFLSYIENL